MTIAGVALIGMAGLLRPALWLAALLFALPAAYAISLPLLPGRALGIIDVGLAGGVAVLVGRRVLLWLAGVESFTAQKAVARVQQVTLLLLAPVSYTHLDVYKRQVGSCPCKLFCGAGF